MEISTCPLPKASVKTSWASANCRLFCCIPLQSLTQWKVLSKLNFEPCYNGCTCMHFAHTVHKDEFCHLNQTNNIVTADAHSVKIFLNFEVHV